MRFNGKVFRKIINNLNPKLARINNANTGLPICASPWLEFYVQTWRNILYKLGIKAGVPDPTYTQGSWSDLPELLRYNEKLRKLLWTTITDDKSIDPVIFNKPFLKEMFRKHMARELDFSFYFILILPFGMWYKNAGLKSITS